MITFTPKKQLFIDSAIQMFGANATLTNQQVVEASKSAGVPKAGWFKKKYKVNSDIDIKNIVNNCFRNF